MTTFDHIARIAAAAVCSLMLTTVAIGATVAPVGGDAAHDATYASAGTSESAGA